MPSLAKLESNKGIVREVTEELRKSKGTVLVDFRGINVSQDTEMRSALRKAGVSYSVVKNTMLRFAVRDLGYTALEKLLEGPTAIATSHTDPVAPAKVMSEYAKKFDKLEIKAGIVEGSVIDVGGVQSLAELPSKEIVISMMLGMMVSPISGLVNVLSANIRGLAVALSAIVDKKRGMEPAAQADG